MNIKLIIKAAAFYFLSISASSAATFSVDFESIIGKYADGSVAVNDFLTISHELRGVGFSFSVDPTDIFGNPNASISNQLGSGLPISFIFDTSRVSVTSVLIGGISDNTRIQLEAFGSDFYGSRFTSAGWSEISGFSESLGLGILSQVDVTLDRASVSSFTIEYDLVSAVPVPAAVWLFASGLIGLVGVGRLKKSK